MNKKILLLLVFLLSLPGSRAITTYDINIQGSDAIVNATFELYTSRQGDRVNYWTTSFSVPESSAILSVSDSKGPILSYNLSDGRVHLETNRGGLKEKEVVNIVFRTRVLQEYGSLKKLNLSLSAFPDQRPDVPDEKTFVSLDPGEEKIISYTSSLGFTSYLDSRTLAGKQLFFSGEGPVSFSVYLGRGMEYNHYVLFGEANLTEADEAYGIVPAIIGILPEYKRIPVVALPESEYERRVNSWSVGEYRGVIYLKGDQSLPTVLHETAHGISERALRWQKTSVAWFDEGIAKYVEFVVNKKAGERQAEIFGNPVEWREGLKIYTLPSRSSPDELWEYYRSGQGFMEEWNPFDSDRREFGYAFSELVIRDFMIRKGPEALHGVLQELLEIREEADSPEEYNSVILGLLDSDFRPCYSPDRSAFDSCLEEINSMEPEVPDSLVIGAPNEYIIIPKIDPPEEEASPFQFIIDFFNSITSAIRGLFGI